MKNTAEYHYDDEDEYDMHTMVNDKYASDRLPDEISNDALADMFSTNGDNNEDAHGTDGHDIEEVAEDIDGRDEARDTERHSRTEENKHDSERSYWQRRHAYWRHAQWHQHYSPW